MQIQYSEQLEIRRLIFTLEQVNSGLYQQNDFLVLPYRNNFSKGVYLPNLDYSRIKKFKQKIPQKGMYDVSKWEIDKEGNFTDEELIFLAEQLKVDLLTEKEVQNCKDKVLQINDSFTRFIQTLFNIKSTEIIIVPTHIGSIASSFRKGNTIFVYWRIDNDISEAIAMILEDFISQKYEGQKLTKEQWENKESFVDNLMINTRLHELFPNYASSQNNLSTNKACDQLKIESSRYLKSIGLSTNDEIFVANNEIWINGKMLDSKKYYFETLEFLKILIKNRGEIVSFYDIGQKIWKGDINKFSLQALAKQIQFARQILEENKLSKDKIVTYRKKGYMLCK